MKPSLSEREGFAAFVLRMRSIGLTDQRLIGAFETTPRMSFVNGSLGNVAYGKGSLPIDCGEFIEGIDLQARLIKALELEPTHRVLEIGTGSGFTAAVMSRLAGRVLSLERYRTLVEAAQQRIQALKIENCILKQADGRQGSSHDGPFDRIIVWAAFETLPKPFVDLLSSNGVLIAPIGPTDGTQTISRLLKVGSRFEQQELMPVRFLPLAEGMAAAL
ncbi:protein-L-isoaspartate(D-aspartate) O-methyltransferase [Phyllobacterium sp. 21LDTY02-6]|jgi:protein-L-isoaspartate(D-aspartate) O-methyltransferase|uniref:protein-L-isoaspartate(D-aspartate) O-methyltransferase n=1 Tax=unclassified Phyllobacterium TaxID=2638441 RepID=UPI00201FE862|nr:MULTISPECIES: protein-L-isoaspartate(D-aspartate) O-methyltransferase [unclassified Phyllobacterium]MCO4316399.1 protein-L-isoaspartate(D-aspartate) O-methyltransferase [Phyllobacterium sp. 21LDTY02-6]MCX8280798.1 protein-L-isoaspartate(D-aspartate) O-methyltransferase [Phyllobacterium sp. 0TCS1.6C]MCX8292625.1 protein-L-isoaspartate(D-aspartate) O-methyltransferase [Phyllobacterium sp. 0TCS1.6A]